MESITAPTFTIQAFQAKWRDTPLKECSAAQEHFIDLCRVLGVPTPAEADQVGAYYTFEKRAAKSSDGKGFADVWWEGKFGWEYKGLHADLTPELHEKRCVWLDPPDVSEAELKQRPLTNLYYQRPPWLEHAHAALDGAV